MQEHEWCLCDSDVAEQYRTKTVFSGGEWGPWQNMPEDLKGRTMYDGFSEMVQHRCRRDESRQRGVISGPSDRNARTEQALQLLTPTWDGNLISKPDRDALVKSGLAQRVDGFNMLTPIGLRTLVDLGYVKAG